MGGGELSDKVVTCHERGYKFIADATRYSAGIAALPGFSLRRMRFSKLVPVKSGFDWIEAFLKHEGLPLTAFVACELRSELPKSMERFEAFNAVYAARLREWGVFAGERNPIARSNVCPQFDAPAEPSLHAFTYVVPDAAARGSSFVVSGAAETIPGVADPRGRVIAFGDTSPEGMRRKSAHVIEALSSRLAALDISWSEVADIQAYSVRDTQAWVLEALAQAGATRSALSWSLCRPPVEGLDYELDCRRVHIETFAEL